MPHPSTSSQPARLLGLAADQAGRWSHIVRTIVGAGVVPGGFGGVAELPALARHGTTLSGLFEMAAAAAPTRLAVVDDDRAVTYRDLSRHVAALAGHLADRHGIVQGTAVGVLARNHVGFVETLLACARLGADAVMLNTGMSAEQAATVVEQQGIALLIADPDLLDLLDQADPDVPRLACGHATPGVEGRVAGATADMLVGGTPRTAAPAEPGRTVVMTSGTTGAPKGARRPASAGPDAAASILSRIPLRAEEATYIAPPLFHTWGFANLQLVALLRSTAVLSRRFDPAVALRLLSVHRCTAMAVVPVMLQRILDLPDDERPAGLDLSALRVVAASGSALQAGLATRWQDAHGPTLYNLYGSTEVSWATIASPEDLAAHPDTAGRPPRGTRLAILDDDGQPVPQGEVGRIFVGNDLHFEGYTGGAASKQVVDGLMATGDVGRIDDGLLFVAGRDDDMIVSGGENVYPKEVEDLLAARDDVAEAAVIGVDDEQFGQRLAAFVVPRDAGSPPDADVLRDHVRANLARFSVPRDVVLLDELPRNPTGKVVPRELRAHIEG